MNRFVYMDELIPHVVALFLSTLLTSEDTVDIPELSTEINSLQDSEDDVTKYSARLAGSSKLMNELERTMRITVRKNRANRRRVDALAEDDFRAKVMRIK